MDFTRQSLGKAAGWRRSNTLLPCDQANTHIEGDSVARSDLAHHVHRRFSDAPRVRWARRSLSVATRPTPLRSPQLRFPERVQQVEHMRS